MAADINTQLQNITTDVTAISNLVNRLVTIFSGGGVQNPDLAAMKAELQAYASNAGNISAGILAPARGGTGRNDGMVTDVYIDTGITAKNSGQIGLAVRKAGLTEIDSLPSGRYYLSDYAGNYLLNGCWGYITKINDAGNPIRNDFWYLVDSVGSTLFSYKNGDKVDFPIKFMMRRNFPFYVDSVNGDDKNDGCTPAKAKKTLASLVSILESMYGTYINVYIYIAPGDYEGLSLQGVRVRLHFCRYSGSDTTQSSTEIANLPKIKYLDFWRCSGIYFSNICVGRIRLMDVSSGSIENYCEVQALNISGSSTIVNNSSLKFRKNNTVASLNDFLIFSSSSYVSLSGGAVSIESGTTNNFLQCGISSYIILPGTIIGTTSGKKIQSDGTSFVNIPASSLPATGSIDIEYQNINRAYVEHLLPDVDNVRALGTADHRFSQLFAGTATINTSDEREKSNISIIPDNVLDAWEEVQFNLFQFNDSIAIKGNNARLHSALVAQRIISIFQKHGLDPFRYSLICYDKWESKDWDEQVGTKPAVYEYKTVVDAPATENEPAKTHEEKILVKPEEPVIEHKHIDGGDRYGIRYEEALCLEAAYQRRRASRLEARIAALEAKMK